MFNLNLSLYSRRIFAFSGRSIFISMMYVKYIIEIQKKRNDLPPPTVLRKTILPLN